MDHMERNTTTSQNAVNEPGTCLGMAPIMIYLGAA